MKTYRITALMLFACGTAFSTQARVETPLRLGIIGVTHGHIGGVFNGGSNLVPAGGLLKRSDVQIVGIAEPDRQRFDQFAERMHLDPNLYFSTIDELISRAHPQAVLVFTTTFDHTKVVEECARRGVHVMMQKPLAVSYKDALAMADAAQKGHIHVLVDYETSWYPNTKAAYDLLQQGALGDPRKIVTHHGHSGPAAFKAADPARTDAPQRAAGSGPSAFANWLIDPKLNGGGALYDFGCYGADLATWLMKGQAPLTVTAVTRQLNPGNHSQVDDEADIILTYPSTVAMIEASWNWPFAVKEIEVYGKTGFAKTMFTATSAARPFFETDKLELRRNSVPPKPDWTEMDSQLITSPSLMPPYDDPLHYFAAVIRGEVQDEGSLSSLKTNVIVSEILDAARRSAQSGKAISLPLEQ